MNILIDIGHPAHVHYYRNLADELGKKGHKIFWTVKNIKVAKDLLNHYGFKYIVLPKKSDNLIGKIFMQMIFDLIILSVCIRKRINIAIGTSVSIAHVSRITNVKSFVFDDDDDEVQPLVTRYVHPFADVLLSPDCLRGKRKREDTVYYPGYHELAYLHPKVFTPDRTVLKDLGIKEDETYFIMRFNTFKAHHDIGIKGLSLNQKVQLIRILEPYGRVLITTEREIEPELRNYQLILEPSKTHSLMYYSKMFLGDSQTMTSEAAVLGVPSLRCNSFARRISYLEEQEKKYGLTYSFLPDNFDKMVEKLVEMLKNPNLRIEWQRKREIMLGDKIDVTSFWLWIIENYPENYQKLKDNPGLIERFR